MNTLIVTGRLRNDPIPDTLFGLSCEFELAPEWPTTDHWGRSITVRCLGRVAYRALDRLAQGDRILVVGSLNGTNGTGDGVIIAASRVRRLAATNRNPIADFLCETSSQSATDRCERSRL